MQRSGSSGLEHRPRFSLPTWTDVAVVAVTAIAVVSALAFLGERSRADQADSLRNALEQRCTNQQFKPDA